MIQNAIVKETTAPIAEQRAALHARISQMTEAAALCGVNIICFQEAWSESMNLDTNTVGRLGLLVNIYFFL